MINRIPGAGLAALVLISGCAGAPQVRAPQAAETQPGVLIVAPDRGFMGNEEARAAVSGLDRANRELVFITDDRSRAYLDAAVAAIVGKGATEVTVLPLFVSEHHPGWQRARDWLTSAACDGELRCRFARPFGMSYLAVDVLEQTLAPIADPANTDLVLLGYGADSRESAENMASDWERVFAWTGRTREFRSVEVFIWDPDDDGDAQRERLRELATRDRTVLVSFQLGHKLDSMMSFDAMLRRWVLRGADYELYSADIDSDVAGMWLQREVNRRLARSERDVGVVVLAHGSDFHWNQTMRDALQPLHAGYVVEYAFSMADRPSVEAALSRLEARGVRSAVIVRVFGRKDSFRATVERMIGMDVESGRPAPGHRHGGHGMGGGRIRTPLVVTSVGGMESHPLFAEALLDRAMALSEDPADETIILVAHGTGDDDVNAAWIDILEELAGHMRDRGGDAFRDIEVATWREDWPDKRGEWIARVREMVTTAQEDGGRALVIPARTNSRGPEREFLEGLTFALGEGFAPHPLFAEWVVSQIHDGVDALTAQDTHLVVQNRAEEE